MIKHAIQVKARRVVADITRRIDSADIRVRIRRGKLGSDTHGLTIYIGICAAILMATSIPAGTRHDNTGIRMVYKRRSKRDGRVTAVTFHADARVSGRIWIGIGTDRDRPIVTG